MTTRISLTSKIRYKDSSGRFVTKDGRSAAGIDRVLLEETKLGDINRLSKLANTIKVSVGFPSTPHRGRPGYKGRKGRITNAQLAQILERGSIKGNIPPRPYFETSTRVRRSGTTRLIEEKLRIMATVPKKFTRAEITKEFQEIADETADDIRKEIFRLGGGAANNAPLTVQLKGRNHPWVDTGELLNSLFGSATIGNISN